MLEDMKVNDLLKLCKILNTTDTVNTFYEIGKCYFIRTVTMHLVGRIKNINSKEILLEKCSWVADSGRFHDAMRTGDLDEIEPFVNDVILNKDCIVDASEWSHRLPENQK